MNLLRITFGRSVLVRFDGFNGKVFYPAMLVVLTGFFLLPWHLHVHPTVSVSYLVGFNNQTSWFFFLAFLALFTFLGPRFVSLETPQGGELSRRVLWWVLAGTLVSTALMYFLQRPISGYGEAGYFCDRTTQLLSGHTPYRDFEFAYGPALLYIPATLARLLHGDLRDAYGVTYVLACLTGTYLLWVTCNWLDGSIAGRRAAFFFFWAASLISTLNYGLNYSLLRFILPIFLLILIHRLARGNGVDTLAPYIAVVVGFILMSCVSPELALALVVGSMLPLVIRVSRSRRRIMLLAFTSVALLVSAGIAFKFGLYGTMFAIRGGYLNFPVVPGPYTLMLLAAAAITGCVAGTQLSEGRHGTALPLLCYSLPASAAALGRCDGGHVLLNGIALFLCAIVAIRSVRILGTIFLWAMWLVYLGPALAAIPTTAHMVKIAIVPAVLAAEPHGRQTRFDMLVQQHKQVLLGPERGKDSFLQLRSAAQNPPAPDLDQVFAQPEGTVLEVPFSFAIGDYGRYQSRDLDPGFFMGLTDVGTTSQVQRKVDELRAHPERPLLLRANWEMGCTDPTSFDRSVVSTLVLFPLRVRDKHRDNIYIPYCDYIKQHYKLVRPADATNYQYGMWVAR